LIESHSWIVEYKSPGLPWIDYGGGFITYHYKCSSCRMRATKSIDRSPTTPRVSSGNSFRINDNSYKGGACDVGDIIPEEKGMSCKDWMLKSVLI